MEIVLGEEICLIQKPDNLENLWQAMGEGDFDEDERLPYWVEIWPSSLILAKWLRSRDDLRNKTCLDLGCGLGLTAIAGQKAGANVLAMDYEFKALQYTRLNAQLNNTPPPHLALMDWRRPAVSAQSADFIWGGDIMYEKRFAAPLLSFMAHALAPGGKVFIAEPGRTVYSSFQECLPSRKWRAVLAHREQAQPPDKATINIWELTRFN